VTYVWRIRKWHPERFGQVCRVLAWGPMNACLVQFADGTKMMTLRWFVREAQ
jgi:hypothetical protein